MQALARIDSRVKHSSAIKIVFLTVLPPDKV
jgi:hypothetical protein